MLRGSNRILSACKGNTHRNGSQRVKDVILKQTNIALPCYLFPVAADLPPVPSDKSSQFSAVFTSNRMCREHTVWLASSGLSLY